MHLAPHPSFRVEGADLETEVAVAPWEAALGGAIEVPIVGGRAQVRLPPGIQGGQKVRLKGKGLSRPEGGRGDLYALIRDRGAEAPLRPGEGAVRGAGPRLLLPAAPGLRRAA